MHLFAITFRHTCRRRARAHVVHLDRIGAAVGF